MSSDRREVRVGVVGYGIMGKAHSYGYRVAPMLYSLPVRPVVAAISGRNAAAVEEAARAYEIPSWTTDWHTLVEDPTIDIIDICTPPGTHVEIAIAAAAAGKAILCEKPLAASYADAASAADEFQAQGAVLAVGLAGARRCAVARSVPGAGPAQRVRIRAGARALPPRASRPLAAVLARGREILPRLARRARLPACGRHRHQGRVAPI